MAAQTPSIKGAPADVALKDPSSEARIEIPFEDPNGATPAFCRRPASRERPFAHAVWSTPAERDLEISGTAVIRMRLNVFVPAGRAIVFGTPTSITPSPIRPTPIVATAISGTPVTFSLTPPSSVSGGPGRRRQRAVAPAPLAGCADDPCLGVTGTCVALTVETMGEGGTEIDGLDIVLTGAATGRRVVPPFAAVSTPPLRVALQLTAVKSGPLHVEVVGVRFGSVVGVGTTDVDIVSGANAAATVVLGGSMARACRDPARSTRCGDLGCWPNETDRCRPCRRRGRAGPTPTA